MGMGLLPNKRMQPTSLGVTWSARGAPLRVGGTPRATLDACG
jgi:hypothetical protein